MRPAVFLMMAILAGCATATPQANVRGDQSMVAPEAMVRNAIEQFFLDYFEALEAGDPAGILALIDSEFLIKWPIGEPISDREALRTALASVEQAFRQEIEWQVMEAHVHGDWAWARVIEKAAHISKTGRETRVLEGSHLAILRKVDGGWLLHRDYGALNALPGDFR